MPETNDSPKPDLKALGILDFDTLVRLAENRPRNLIEGLLAHQAVGILVGNPGIGKTPLVVSIGLSVVAGLPVFGHAVESGPVLYCIGEGSLAQTVALIETLSGHLGLAAPPPGFHIHSPYWGDKSTFADGIPGLLDRARALKPILTIVDTLRAFDSTAEKSSEYGSELCKNVRAMNAEVGCSTLIVHHQRKPSQDSRVDLEKDPHAWFNEAVGTNSLITQVDSRLGVDVLNTGPADLVLGGFVRGDGLIPPHYLVRRFGPDGEAVGYDLLSGLDRLSPKQRTVFEDLEGEFTFTDLKKGVGGNSDSNAANLLNLLRSTGLVEKLRPSGSYRKKP